MITLSIIFLSAQRISEQGLVNSAALVAFRCVETELSVVGSVLGVGTHDVRLGLRIRAESEKKKVLN